MAKHPLSEVTKTHSARVKDHFTTLKEALRVKVVDCPLRGKENHETCMVRAYHCPLCEKHIGYVTKQDKCVKSMIRKETAVNHYASTKRNFCSYLKTLGKNLEPVLQEFTDNMGQNYKVHEALVGLLKAENGALLGPPDAATSIGNSSVSK